MVKRLQPRELSFADLRRANILRLPKFKTKKGAPAHRLPDGSDWTPAQWLMAVIGELGEYAEVRWQFEQGMIDFKTYEQAARKELADVMIYLDILALRSMDITTRAEGDHANLVQKFMMFFGCYANVRKKEMRGDLSHTGFLQFTQRVCIQPMRDTLEEMIRAGEIQDAPTQEVQHASVNGGGVRIWQAVRDKFNLTSRRMGIGIELGEAGVVVGPDRDEPGTPATEVPAQGEGV